MRTVDRQWNERRWWTRCDLGGASPLQWERISSKGQEYSIAENAVEEFLNWDSMPWEYFAIN